MYGKERGRQADSFVRSLAARSRASHMGSREGALIRSKLRPA